MARRTRRRRRYGNSAETHRGRADHSNRMVIEHAERAESLARKGVCGQAAAELSNAEYWRGRSDAEEEGAGTARLYKNPAVSAAAKAVSKCFIRKGREGR